MAIHLALIMATLLFALGPERAKTNTVDCLRASLADSDANSVSSEPGKETPPPEGGGEGENH